MARSRTIERQRPVAQASDSFDLFEQVSLRFPQQYRNTQIVPSGTVGTVVEILARGKQYIVEFDDPDQLLLDVAHVNLVRAQ